MFEISFDRGCPQDVHSVLAKPNSSNSTTSWRQGKGYVPMGFSNQMWPCQWWKLQFLVHVPSLMTWQKLMPGSYLRDQLARGNSVPDKVFTPERSVARRTMVRTSKTDHFFKLAPFWSPLTDLIDFGMVGKLLTSATRWCSPFVDSMSRIWIKPKKITDWLLGSNGYNLWPISTVASTTNGRPQRSQPPFRAAVLGQFSLP